MISLFFLVVGMCLCSSLKFPSEEVRSDGKFVRFIQADDYPTLGSETINNKLSNTTGQLVRKKRQDTVSTRFDDPFTQGRAGRVNDAFNSGLTILDFFLRTGDCCPSDAPLGNWCVDGSQGAPHCAYGTCNIVGCNCDGGCKMPPDDASVAIVYESDSFGAGIFRNGGHRAFVVDSNTCINFGYFNDAIRGVYPLNGCVRVWEDIDCGGASMCVCDPIADLSRFELRDGTSWEDQISSMDRC